MRPLLGALLLAGFLAPSARGADEPWIGWDLGCDSQQIRLADPRDRWLVLEGLEGADEEDGGRALDRPASLLLLLGEPSAETTVYLEARTTDRRAEVDATLNGTKLGTLTFRRRLEIQGWPVPPGVARRGVNVLRLERVASRARSDRRLVARRVGVGPQRCRGRDPAAVAVDGGKPFTLAASSLVLAPLAGSEPATTPRQLRISFTAREVKTAVEVSCWTADRVHPVGYLRGGSSRRARDFLPLDGVCAEARGLALMGLGPGAADRVNARLGAARDWRRTIRRLSALTVPLALVFAVALAVWLRRRDRPVPASAPGPWTTAPPWLDVVGVCLLALLPRLIFHLLYPHPGEAGDSYEYLLRAGLLIDGKVDFWRDLQWHSWGRFVRPPGYFALLALLDAPSPAGRGAIVWLHLLLSTATAGLTYLLTLPLFGRLAAWCAGLLFAGYLASIATYSRILAEPLFLVLALGGLTAIAWLPALPARPVWRLALIAGALFGLAALVRPGPVYFPPLAGLLLIPTLGWKRGLSAAGWLVLGLAAIIAPWSLRNNLAAGVRVGVENVSVANLLLAHPDERVVSAAGLDLERAEDYDVYRARVHRLEPSPLTRSKGPHVRRILAKAASDPLAHAGLVARNLRDLFGTIPDAWLRWILGESDVVRVAWLTSLLNVQYGLLLALAGAGFLLFLRRPRTWPVAAWFFFNSMLLTFFFYAIARYREPTTPVLMAFAGGLLALLVERLAGAGGGDSAPRPVVEKTRLS